MANPLAELVDGLPTGQVITDPEILETYRRDRSAFASAGTPQAAVIARSVTDVQTLLSIANENQIAVVTRGAGSGLSGGANALDDCIVLVTDAMTRVIDVNASDLQATVEPGVINASLKERARSVNLYYPPDPASSPFSTVGGNIATNAGGLCCVKYGVTRDYVMAVDVVLADGRLLHTGSTTRKSVAGYDLTSLIVGSEGTLGVIVGATLRLIPTPDTGYAAVATFPSLDRVGELPSRLAEAGITPSMLEVIDQVTINAIEDHYPMGLDRNLGALIIAQTDGPDGGRQVERIATVAIDLGAIETHHTADPVEAEMLIQSRKLAFPALERSDAMALLDDVAVPFSRIPRLIGDIRRISEMHQVRIATFGHLGDGNLHPTLLYNHRDPSQQDMALRAFDAIIDSAIDLGGTITGEHGIGNLKTRHLTESLDRTAIQIHFEIKRALDPHNVLNPGKGLPIHATNFGKRPSHATPAEL